MKAGGNPEHRKAELLRAEEKKKKEEERYGENFNPYQEFSNIFTTFPRFSYLTVKF